MQLLLGQAQTGYRRQFNLLVRAIVFAFLRR